MCQDLEARKEQHRAAVVSATSLQQELTAYEELLERVEVFKYLGRLIAFDDNDAQAMQSNLMKARKCWSRISRVLRAEHASPRVCGLFYKATVQAVLLFGSEMWNLTPSALKCLEGFHIRAARRMSGMMPVKDASTSVWNHPASADVLEAAGLYTVKEYIEVRRQTIAAFIVNRPIFNLCRGGRRRGSSNRQFWWEQPFDLEEARASAPAAAAVVSDDEEEE